MKDFGGGIGFNKQSAADKEYSRGVLQKALNKTFSPEFLNRVDDIITFDQLDKTSIEKIIDIELKGFYKRMFELGYTIELSQDAKDFLADKGYDVQFGARPLKRAIQNYVEDEIAELILSGKVKEGAKIIFEVNKESDKLKAVTE